MIVAQVFLEAMEGCHLFLSPFFVMQTRVFRVSPSTIVQIFVSPGCKNGLPLISSSGVGSPSRLSSSVSFHSFRRAFAPALQRCSFSSSSQPELLFLAGFLRSFGSCPFSHGSQALFSVLGTFVGHFESCPLAVSCEALPLLAGFVGPFDNFPFAVTCEALFPLLAGFVGPSESCSFALSCEALFLCSLVSLTRLTAARLRSSARSRSPPCSLVSLTRFWRSAHNSCCLAAASSRARISWALFSRLKGSASNPFSDDIFASSTSLSFDIFFWTQNLVKWRSFTKFPRHVCAFTQKSRQNCRIPMTSGWRPWQTDRETPRELTASCHLRGEDATLRAELLASTVFRIFPL